jgi:hypothetical protein
MVSRLLHHRAGNFYASAKVGGKVIRQSLDTEEISTPPRSVCLALLLKSGRRRTRAWREALAPQSMTRPTAQIQLSRKPPGITTARFPQRSPKYRAPLEEAEFLRKMAKAFFPAHHGMSHQDADNDAAI